MDVEVGQAEEVPEGLDEVTQEDYASLSKLLQGFIEIPTIDKAWSFRSGSGMSTMSLTPFVGISCLTCYLFMQSAAEEGSHAMFMISQPSLLANKRRKSVLSSYVVKESNNSVKFHWSPFPTEITGVSAMVPSPSGSKLLVIRNAEGDLTTHFEIWGPSEVKKEFVVPPSIHGSVYSDGWFEGISWNSDETALAYVAEEPDATKPTFNGFGYQKEGTTHKDCGSWKGQGDWEEDWGESYAGKRQPALFVIDIDRFEYLHMFHALRFNYFMYQVLKQTFCSGEVCPVAVGRALSVGQVEWAPSKYLVFVGWPSNRKLGIKYCYNRPCALYAAKAPSFKSEVSRTRGNSAEDLAIFNLTRSISSAFFPRFRPDGKFLVFLSAKSSVDSGAHMATDSLHKIDWPSDGELSPSLQVVDVVPVVMCPEYGCFPGLYCSNFLSKPWLSDGHTMVLSSVWGSAQTILSVNVLSGKVSRISPKSSNSSWNLLAIDGDDIIAECSSPIDIPQIKYGSHIEKISADVEWSWLDILSPLTKCSENAVSCLASLQFSILKIPVRGLSENFTKGSNNPFEAIYVSSTSKKSDVHDPLITILHGGPHDVAFSSFSKTSAFLCVLGFSLLIVNYRGSRGFGEEALQSLPGKVGSQDVDDVLTAIDHVIDKGLAHPSKIAVVGLSHGGFLATHLIGQAPDKFSAAAARNPVCNFALMVGTSDIPDWCFFLAYGNEGNPRFTESPSAEHLDLFYSKSPISHVSKVKTPTLFLLGARDVRVPMTDGLQYARALREKGVETKVIVFPNDIHPINSYMLASGVIGMAYTILQTALTIFTVSTGNRLGGDGFAFLDFFGDKVISYLLATGAAAGFGLTVDSARGVDDSAIGSYFQKANVSASLLFIGFLFVAISSVFSSLSLPKRVE
ncbi:hypothetical protein RD792_005098 [Penstemon davidsonii]|uniref:acylaminoacyl-peptidase n=1 Tax=Penstemon davidsonii TaxID=160366 RepID=A0ABR0DJA5_9LAMI|nr:hypothetical protein RD792_005098 [Penstemon davidsonii]